MANVTISNPEVCYGSVYLRFYDYDYMEEWQDSISFSSLGVERYEVEEAWIENHGKVLVVEVYDRDNETIKEIEFSVQDVLELMEN